jgi:hypothetical protein
MPEQLKPSEVLSRAADLIEPEGAWNRFALAYDKRGGEVDPDSPKATCWCAAGSLQRFASWHSDTYEEARQYIARVINEPLVASWNDDPDRKQAEVVAALRQAADLARSEGQ